ncbi:MAG: nucleotidyltransferase domain-containing protein [Spirochaetales bacterium]|nr:nucleotidyltransferase domain-containing protein [Spirochaetales bacterium]
MWKITETYFSPLATLSNYLGICRKFTSTLEDKNSLAIKKPFYILRPLYAAPWICTEKFIPPMTFQKLMKRKDIPQEISLIINEILNQRFQANEKTRIEIPDSLIQHIQMPLPLF